MEDDSSGAGYLALVPTMLFAAHLLEKLKQNFKAPVALGCSRIHLQVRDDTVWQCRLFFSFNRGVVA
jgi:hypothetical protein